MTEENADTTGTTTPAPVTEASPAPAPEPSPTPAPDWAPDWRVKLAGGDEKRAKAYEKYASPKDVADAHLSLQQQLSSGEYVRRLPKDAKPEQIAEWRKNNGIPESPDKYDFNLPDGLVLGEADLAVARNFAAEMHEINADQKTVQKALTWWTKNQQLALQNRQQEDAEYRKQTEDTLRAQWGGEYRMNEAAISNVLAGLPEDLSASITQARTPEGKLLWDNPAFRSYMLNQALLENPARTIIPGGEGNSLDNINQQLADIKKISQEDPHRYYKDTALQEKRAKLLQAQQTLSNRKTA